MLVTLRKFGDTSSHYTPDHNFVTADNRCLTPPPALLLSLSSLLFSPSVFSF